MEKNLHNLEDEIASSKGLLNLNTSCCKRKKQEQEHLNNEISRLVAFVN
jgi:hypothetical protein